MKAALKVISATLTIKKKEKAQNYLNNGFVLFVCNPIF
jgi:hypothetical protein